MRDNGLNNKFTVIIMHIADLRHATITDDAKRF